MQTQHQLQVGNHQQVGEESAEDGEEDSEAALALEEEALFIAFHNLKAMALLAALSALFSLSSRVSTMRLGP